MAVVQNTYAERIAKGSIGSAANETNWDADTRIVETVAGIGFGLAVGQGTNDKGAVIGGTLANFVGVSMRDITLVNATPDTYARYQNMAVMTEGDIWVAPTVAVSPTDPVHYDAATGKFATSGGSGPIAGARWMTSADANQPAVLRLSGHLPVP